MKAIVCVEPNQFKMSHFDRPVPKAGEALVRIRRIGICGTDMHAYRGKQPYFTYPRILGHELAGEVVETTGSGNVKVGDQVAILPYLACGQCSACTRGKTNCCEKLEVFGVHCDGGMREYVALPKEHLIVTNSISLDGTALVECLAIGAHAVRRADITPGQFALVIGAGPIGLGVMKFLNLAGARVIAMDINKERLDFSKQWGAAEFTVDASDHPQQRITDITAGALAEAVFDATGNVKSMEGAFDYAAFGGKVVYVSLVKGNISFSDPEFHKKEMTLLGSRNATQDDFHTVIRAIEHGHIDVDAFITHRASFDAMIGKFEEWMKPETGVVKALVEL